MRAAGGSVMSMTARPAAPSATAKRLPEQATRCAVPGVSTWAMTRGFMRLKMLKTVITRMSARQVRQRNGDFWPAPNGRTNHQDQTARANEKYHDPQENTRT